MGFQIVGMVDCLSVTRRERLAHRRIQILLSYQLPRRQIKKDIHHSMHRRHIPKRILDIVQCYSPVAKQPAAYFQRETGGGDGGGEHNNLGIVA